MLKEAEFMIDGWLRLFPFRKRLRELLLYGEDVVLSKIAGAFPIAAS